MHQYTLLVDGSMVSPAYENNGQFPFCTEPFADYFVSSANKVLASEKLRSYHNDSVVSRFARDYKVNENDALRVFKETKQFLYDCSKSAKPLTPPSKEVDQMWHTFILFTKDYAAFCLKHFGKFIHHTPIALSAGCNSDQGGSQEDGGMDCNSDGNG